MQKLDLFGGAILPNKKQNPGKGKYNPVRTLTNLQSCNTYARNWMVKGLCTTAIRQAINDFKQG